MTIQQLTLPYKSVGVPAAGTRFDTVTKEIKVIALIKGKEEYVFLYDESNRAETLRTLGRYASNPELSFTWYDAAVLSQKIRQESLQQTRDRQSAELPPQGVPFPIDELF
ncbi:MAG: hypothetical protein LBI05_07135 [Planctomycetaceae bacterium]|jgi:hypothetical protein|nr:hypothetical protein [Planctomycetaceae bacterium]